jgi:hypothetical protein
MPRLVPDQQPDIAVYLVVNDFHPYGVAYVETDTAEAHRESIIRKFITGQYDNPVSVVAFNAAACGVS